MAVSDIGYWELVLVTVLRALVVALAFLAFLSLRRTEPVVLRARIFMNFKNVQRGLFALGVAMSFFLVQVVAELWYVRAEGERLPLEFTTGLVLVGVAFLVLGFWQFYTLPRPTARPSEARR